MALLYDTYFLVGFAFVVFIGVLAYYRVHDLLFRALDQRAERIRRELDDAQRLREEAQALLAGYERRQRDTEEEAKTIVARAREDAQDAAEQAKRDLEESIQRRLKAAEEQIATAEAAAVAEVRDRAVAVATAAAAEVIARNMTGAAANERIDAAIEEVGRKLH